MIGVHFAKIELLKYKMMYIVLVYIHTYILKIRPSHYIHVSFDSSFAYKTAYRFELYFESK